MTRLHRVLLCGLVLCAAVAGQQPQEPGPAFDVVSIKVDRQPGIGVFCSPPDGMKCRRTGRWTVTHWPLTFLIRDAYGPSVTGAPAWANNTYFDVVATLNPSVSDDQFREMLRGMLATRFHLVMHEETKSVDVAIMGLAGSPAGLARAGGACVKEGPVGPGDLACGAIVERSLREERHGGILTGRVELVARSVSIADLASYISHQYAGGLPILDETGLAGRFDFDIVFTVPSPPEGPMQYAENIVDVESAIDDVLHRELGLRLDLLHPAKRPQPVFVVESVSMPTPN